MRQAPRTAAPGMAEAFVIQARVIGALILRETRTRFGASKIGYVWALLEPIGHVVVLGFVYFLFGRKTPVGNSLELYFITGIFPYFLYEKTGTRLSGALTANKALLNLPMVRNLDVIFARAILELATILVVLLILIAGLVLAGVEEAIPFNPVQAGEAFLVMWLFGTGIGSINAVINSINKSWDNIFKLLTRPIFLLSGIFYSVDHFPEPFRTYLLYNPIIHGVEWFRSGFYEDYSVETLDKPYLIAWAFCSLVAGLALEWVMAKKISSEV